MARSASAATERHRALPNVPTFREQGFDLVVTEWYGLFAPKGTPKPIVAKLNAEMRRILALDLGERVAAIDLGAFVARGAWRASSRTRSTAGAR